MRKRAAFLTIGQAPRPDILDEMRPAWSDALEVREMGALDGLDENGVRELAPADGEARLVSRLSNGSEVVLSAEKVHQRLGSLMARLDHEPLDFVVLLCTGRFDELTSSHPLLKPQAIVDGGVEALRAGATTGVLVPDPSQAAARGGLCAHASPYRGDRFAEASRELLAADLIVLHCMGYTAEHKRRVAELTEKPVLLAREMVASAVSWLAL